MVDAVNQLSKPCTLILWFNSKFNYVTKFSPGELRSSWLRRTSILQRTSSRYSSAATTDHAFQEELHESLAAGEEAETVLEDAQEQVLQLCGQQGILSIDHCFPNRCVGRSTLGR